MLDIEWMIIHSIIKVTMVTYSIKDMEHLTGVKAHTLRIWEKRYNILIPKRTPTNIRYYTDEDLRTLLNVCFLNNKGYKISKIAKMSPEEIKIEFDKHSAVDLNEKDSIDTLMVFVLELDSYNLSMMLSHYIDQLGLERTMGELIYPLMDRIGMAWLSGEFQNMHESFVTQLIKQKIQSCIDLLPEESDFGTSYVIYLPQGDTQELSLLYLHYLLKLHRCRVVNLGYDASMQDVISASQVVKADYLFTIINNELPIMSIDDYIREISASIYPTKFLATGFQVVSLSTELNDKVTVFKNLEETLNFIVDKKS